MRRRGTIAFSKDFRTVGEFSEVFTTVVIIGSNKSKQHLKNRLMDFHETLNLDAICSEKNCLKNPA